MTKRKTGVFRGGWLDGNVTSTAPVPRFLSQEQREQKRKEIETAEQEARGGLRRLILNHGHRIKPQPIIGELLRQVEVWRFSAQRLEVEPEPNEWADLIDEIQVPESPTQMQALDTRRQVGRLPLQVLAVLDGALLRARAVGRVELMRRLCEEPTAEDARLLREQLADMREALRYFAGKKGPRLSVGPALRAVSATILQHSDLGKEPARQLAAELLGACGIKCPKGRSQLSRLMKEI